MSSIKYLKGADQDLLELESYYQNWQGLLKMNEHSTVKACSLVGGQGIDKYNYNGKCNTMRCACKKANRPCIIRCHLNNTKYTNKE